MECAQKSSHLDWLHFLVETGKQLGFIRKQSEKNHVLINNNDCSVIMCMQRKRKWYAVENVGKIIHDFLYGFRKSLVTKSVV